MDSSLISLLFNLIGQATHVLNNETVRGRILTLIIPQFRIFKFTLFLILAFFFELFDQRTPISKLIITFQNALGLFFIFQFSSCVGDKTNPTVDRGYAIFVNVNYPQIPRASEKRLVKFDRIYLTFGVDLCIGAEAKECNVFRKSHVLIIKICKV